MHEAILEAVRSGRLDALREPIELNEIKPVIGDAAEGDPIEALRALSSDGSGRDVLAAIGAILACRWATVPAGRDLENNRVFVWPRFAETGLADLPPAERADLAKLVPPDALARMQAAGTYQAWRLGIGADGTWHFLRK